MEDEGAVKAPVTRLRRRLSVEQSDDARSSPAPNTPTKKRGNRRVAKPDLDLIDENVTEYDTPKKLTKKGNMKELEVEEKPVTPSRRSARIKSNTSIVLETSQPIDSPRAKRASRRTSQAGSDNEAPLTPARLTRRTRKDSANADKADSQPANKPITEVIVEEPETILQKSLTNEQSQSPTGIRKSPRLSLNKNKKSDSVEINDKEINKSQELKNNTNLDSTELNKKEIHNSEEDNKSNKENELSENNETQKKNLPIIKLVDISTNLLDMENNKLSKSNLELLHCLDTKPKQEEKHLNKSSSAVINNQEQCFNYKRSRTKSWAGLCDSVENINKCYSDSESSDKTKKSLKNYSNNNITRTSSKDTKGGFNLSTNKERKSLDESSKEVKTDIIDLVSSEEKSSGVTNLFDKEPTNALKTMVYIEESDSNSEKLNTHTQVKEEDQCVPIVETYDNQKTLSPQMNKVKNILNNSQANESNNINIIKKNDSCEPMDIDETISDNLISNKSQLNVMVDNTVSSKEKSEINCRVYEKDESRRSSITLTTPHSPDKITNENKSTFVLSQLKDITNENSMSQSLPITSEKKLSNSDQTLNFTQDYEVDKKNLSVNYSTSTPLQQKNLIKQPIQVNTSGIVSNNTGQVDKRYKHPTKNVSNTDKSGESESSDESSQEGPNFMNDEAEEASNDYESGDSRDEEEEQYEREHEIIQKGETLTSEEDLSNDTDYEKDSFVVSSDQEDDELLDGSGDDLSMSDNELKMTAKSKKKYNERKIKEQKKASREIYESRHKLKVSHKNNKSDLLKESKNSENSDSSSSEDENVKIKVKKNKRMRLDSSQDGSMNKSECDINEVELTAIADDIKNEIDPLSIEIKNEPKTPQKGTVNTSIQFVDTELSKTKDPECNKSQLNMTQVEDPLEEANSSENSDSSNNIHIKNYDSVLNDLNKSMDSKSDVKGDISLNLDKKTKQKSEPIIDHLNLTQIKSKKKKENETTLSKNKKSVNNKLDETAGNKYRKNKLPEDEKVSSSNECLNDVSNRSLSKKEFNNKDHDDESSDSIDLHLLFSEDSNNTEDVEIKDGEGEQINDNDSYILLKTSRVKTDILKTSESNDQLPHKEIIKKKKKTELLDRSANKNENSANETEVQFFLDTTGTHSTAVDKSLNISTTKKKKEKHLTVELEDSDSDAPMEISNKSLLETQNQQININEVVEQIKSKIKTPKSDKKKRLSESQIKESIDLKEKKIDTEDDYEGKIDQSGIDRSINKSVAKTPQSDKKKSKRISESHSAESKDTTLDSDAPITLTYKSVTETLNVSVSALNNSVTKTPKSDKKKKRTSESQMQEQSDQTEETVEVSVHKTPKSEKKKAKRISESQITEQKDAQDTNTKNKSAVEEHQIQIKMDEKENKTGNVNDNIDAVTSKKRKRKSSLNQIEQEPVPEESIPFITSKSTTNISTVTISQNKKRKISHNIEDSKNLPQAPGTKIKIKSVEKQQIQEIGKQQSRLENKLYDKTDDTEANVSKKKDSKKRKDREDDEGNETAKVLKVDTNKMQVPRLPVSVLNQLEDRPRKKNQEVIKPKAISTCNFFVEETKIKKPKPSNYLEESVYLNEDGTFESKKQKHIRNPKVLPFLPTVSTSNSGFTTDFKVNILPKQIQFVAKSINTNNYKNDYLQNKKIKRLGTYELYKRNRNIKMSKF